MHIELLIEQHSAQFKEGNVLRNSMSTWNSIGLEMKQKWLLLIVNKMS